MEGMYLDEKKELVEDMNMDSIVYEFEKKLMTPSKEVQMEARKMLMGSKELKDVLLEKYEPVLKPLIEKNNKNRNIQGTKETI